MNINMIDAQKNRNDEFYTQYKDIEKEVDNYWKILKDKIVYCNTDNYKHSNFVKYFMDNFHDVGLRKIISLDLDGNYFEYDGMKERKHRFKSGDFRCKDSIDILKSADVVITNPPFSLFREYMAQIREYNKDFLIIGNFNAVTYKEIFPMIKNNKMWIGHTSPKKFIQPDNSMKKFGNITWFTNISNERRQQPIALTKFYDEDSNCYPTYDNYDAIEVSRVADIPKDYKGIMGVPITFLNKYNPEQFEILGSRRWSKSQELLGVYKGDVEPPENDKKTTINGKETYDRIFVKHI